MQKSAMGWKMLGLTFVTSLGASFLLLQPSMADGAWAKQHAYACQLETGTLVTPGSTDYGEEGLKSDGEIAVNCSFPETSSFTKSSITEVSIVGSRTDNPYSFDDEAYAKVCRSFTTSADGECGNATYTTATGNIDLSISDLSKWNNSTGLGYIHAEFKGWGETVRGMYFGQ